VTVSTSDRMGVWDVRVIAVTTGASVTTLSLLLGLVGRQPQPSLPLARESIRTRMAARRACAIFQKVVRLGVGGIQRERQGRPQVLGEVKGVV
jgi:hypothetical protein